MEVLFQIFDFYAAWRGQEVLVYQGVAGVIGAVAALYGAYVQSQQNGPDSSAGLETAAQFEAAESGQRVEIMRRLRELADTTPSAMSAILEATGGEGFRLPRTLAEARDPNFSNLSEILGSIDFDTQNRAGALERLLGHTSQQSSATQSLALLNNSNQRNDEEILAQLVQDIVFSLQNRNNSSSANSGGRK